MSHADTELPPRPAAAPLAPATPPSRTVADLLAEVIVRGKSPQTRRAYRADLEDFLVWLVGGTVVLPAEPDDLRHDTPVSRAINATLARLQQVTEADISTYRQHLAPRPGVGLTPATVNRRLTPLRLLFQRLQRYHLIGVNPMEFVKGHKLSGTSPTVYLSRAQARQLLDLCDGPTLRDLRDRALLTFMLRTGVRSTEALGLQVDDLTMVDGHQVAWVTGKGGARERVKVPPEVARQVRHYLAAAGITSGSVFQRLRAVGPRPPADGAPRQYRAAGRLSYAGLYFILTTRFRNANLDPQLAEALAPHSTRHTFITLAIRGGASIAKAQAAARHADPRTTMRYAHDMDDLDDNAVDYVKI